MGATVMTVGYFGVPEIYCEFRRKKFDSALRERLVAIGTRDPNLVTETHESILAEIEAETRIPFLATLTPTCMDWSTSWNRHKSRDRFRELLGELCRDGRMTFVQYARLCGLLELIDGGATFLEPSFQGKEIMIFGKDVNKKGDFHHLPFLHYIHGLLLAKKNELHRLVDDGSGISDLDFLEGTFEYLVKEYDACEARVDALLRQHPDLESLFPRSGVPFQVVDYHSNIIKELERCRELLKERERRKVEDQKSREEERRKREAEQRKTIERLNLERRLAQIQFPARVSQEGQGA